MKCRVIELVADVTNPAADRRSRDWNKTPLLKKGQRFTVHEGKDFEFLYSCDHRYSHEIAHSDLGKAILANSVTAEAATVTELARVHDCDFSGDEILRILVKLGRVDDTDFAAVGEALAADESL
jgi:hypothetical protein